MTTLSARLEEVKHYLQIEQKRYRRAELQESSAEPGFWDNPQAAQAVMGEISRLGDDIKAYDSAFELLEEARSADELALEADDEETSDYAGECIERLGGQLDELELSSWFTGKFDHGDAVVTITPGQGGFEAQDWTEMLLRMYLRYCEKELELSSWFTGKFDHGDAVVTITPGQGGFEAQDWTEMLLRMYLRYCEKRHWKVEVTDAPVGELIGLDRATFTVSGKDAFGMLSAEAGVHRLVRISPTDDKKRRQTTFAGVEVLPLLTDDIQVDIDPADVRVDVYHASGPGGQGVNTTDSAVRLTHAPSGIVVTCQNERSQLQNKAIAWQILRSKLYELERERREAEIDELRGPKRSIGFGNQIRSYVLYPYQMIKDLRTGYETSNVDDVLSDGDLDPFVISYHRWRVLEAQKVSDVQ